MNIEEQVKADLTSAIKERNEDKKSILRVLIGEFNRYGKSIPDENSIPIIKKMMINANETGNIIEANILECYLPKQLTDDNLDMVISQMIIDTKSSGMKDMGKIMGMLKEQFGGQYDGKLASQLVKEKLT